MIGAATAALWLALAVAQPSSPADSAALVASVRRAESAFFLEWRKLWESAYSHGHLGSSRLDAVHCHSDASYGRPVHIIKTTFSPRSMCPIWYTDEPLAADERVDLDVALPPRELARARALRRPVLALLDSAASVLPGDRFIAGQRVRLYLDHGDPARALDAAHDCRADGPTAWCTLLVGYVLHRRGAVVAADSAFMAALSAMTDDERCTWNDVSLLLPEPDRLPFRQLGCSERAPLADRFWWLADPLYSEPGNERRAEHFVRELDVRLHRALTFDERWDWLDEHGGGAIAEMLVRYGWPSFVGWGGGFEDRSHFQWLGFTDSSVNVSAEYSGARVHTAPDFAQLHSVGSYQDPSLMAEPRGRAPGFETEWWPVEHFSRTTPLIHVDNQFAAFRREHDDPVFVAAMIPQRQPLLRGARAPATGGAYAASLFSSTGPRALTAVDTRRVGAGDTSVVLAARLTPGMALLSAELISMGADPAPAGRARFGTGLPETLSSIGAGAALSDIMLFAPAGPSDALPDDVGHAAARMLASTTFAGKRLGVFWEVYGVASDDSIEVSLRIAQTDPPGIIMRLGNKLGLGNAGSSSIVVRWREPQPGRAGSSTMSGGVPVQARSVVVDVSRLRAGGYEVELTVTPPGRHPVSTRRTLAIVRT